MPKKSFDVFISHASEDKEAFVEPLALELRKRGLVVWYDKFELKIGDSLRESIERGLSVSRFGVVVFSPSFFKKRWPKKELNGLFSRELSGNKKKILPILHGTSIDEIRKRFPIQSDRFFLQSTLDLDELCQKLISEIKPDLLRLGNLKTQVFDLSDSFIDSARKEHPGYDFSISTNPTSNPGRKQIEIRMTDPSAVISPPIVNITFTGEGVRKAQEFVRTGKPQKWTTGEFGSVTSKMPFFTDMTQGEILVGASAAVAPRPVGIRCGKGEFPYLLMKILRHGTDEAEVEITSDTEPITIRFVHHFKKKRAFDIGLSYKLGTTRATRLAALSDFLDGLADSNDIQITDLSGAAPVLNIPLAKRKRFLNPLSQSARNVIRVSAQAEHQFGQPVIPIFNTSEDDQESLTILNSLLNHQDVPVQVSTTLTVRKGENPQVDAMISAKSQSTLSLFTAVEDFRGFIPLFGRELRIPLWGLAAECRLCLTDEEREQYSNAPEGTVLACKISNDRVARYRWAADFGESANNANKREANALKPNFKRKLLPEL
ncbi:MAG TPA: toll/interleukin-1 receptor domain-containing protein [Acidobacteriaceae bacterium]